MKEPTSKRTIVYIDGQNLFNAAKEAFGYPFPNYNIHDPNIDPDRHHFWVAKLSCAFPFSPTLRNKRGINSTDWIKMDRTAYDACIDPNDYRRKKKSAETTRMTKSSSSTRRKGKKVK